MGLNIYYLFKHIKTTLFLLHWTTSYDIINGFSICFTDFVFAASKVGKTCHKVSVIHVTQLKLCPIQIVVSDIVDQTVTNLQLKMSFI